MCRRRHGKRLVGSVALPSIESQSFTTNTVTSLFACLSLSLSLCFESVFFLFMGRAGGREQRRQYMVFEASMELESGNIEEKRWSWFRGKGRDTDKKFDGGGRVEIDAVDGGEELVQR
ncbi:unnamed protein product [Brassica oleracea var. botrytis]